MADALIENPILNSPFHEPDRHFKITDEGITNEIVEIADPWNAESIDRGTIRTLATTEKKLSDTELNRHEMAAVDAAF
jgi:hypothetical protein